MVIGTDLTVEADFGNGATTEWPFGFRIDRAADLVVILVDPDGVETLLSEGSGSTDYIVNVARYPGSGSVTYPASGSGRLPAGWRIIRRRVVALVQGTDLKNQGAYKPEQVEAALDYGRMIDQQQQEALDRTIKAPISDNSGADYTLPPPVSGAIIGAWDTEGKAIVPGPDMSGVQAARDQVLAIQADLQAVADALSIAGPMAAANNLSEITDPAAARANIGAMAGINNLSEVTDPALARANIGAMTGADNLAEIAAPAAARANIGAAPALVPILYFNSSHTLDGTENGHMCLFSGEATVTVPNASSVPFEIGTSMAFHADANGPLTLAPADGVELWHHNTVGTMRTQGPYSTFSILKVSTNTWIVAGNVDA